MKPYDTTAKDVRNLFDLIHHYDMNYDNKILSSYKLKENALDLIKSILYFAWTDEAGTLLPTDMEINKFLVQSMQVIVKTNALNSPSKVFEKYKETYVRKEKITIEVSIDYPDERLSVTLFDYI